jgi:beta-fructofuranosidase
LTQWRYRGVLFQLPDADARTAECPNFFKLGDSWVLVTSPYGRPQYFIGDFDPDQCRFAMRSRGTLDCDGHFYAPNTMQIPDGRRIMWGWVNGFPGGHGWNGCLSLPRLLTLSPEGQLRQSPAPELTQLRGDPVKRRNVMLWEGGRSFKLPRGNAMEIRLDVDLKTCQRFTVAVKTGTNTTPSIVMSYGDSKFKMMGEESPLTFAAGKERLLVLRIFIDHSVVEVFVNDELCGTTLISPPVGDSSLEMNAEGGEAKAKLVEAWPIKTIWEE